MNEQILDIEKKKEQPWKHRYFTPISVELSLLDSEIMCYWDTKAIGRPGYSYDENVKNVTIPHFFVKINGLYKNKGQYINFVKGLESSKNTCVYRGREQLTCYYSSDSVSDKLIEMILDSKTSQDVQESLIKIIKKNPRIVSNKILKDKQDKILMFMSEIIFEKLQDWDNNDINKFLKVCFNINDEISVLINNFDYDTDIPKIIFENYSFSSSDPYLLLLLNKLCFDILILQTDGMPYIEKYINVSTMSLGYFEKFDIEKEMITKKEKFKKFIKNAANKLLKAETLHIIFYVIFLISICLSIASIFLFSPLEKTIIEILTPIILIIISIILYNMDEIDSDDLAIIATTIYTIFMAVILFGRLIFSVSPIESYNTTIAYTGTLNQADNILDTTKGYIIYSDKDVIIENGTCNMYLYVENNKLNDTNMRFEILIDGNQRFISEKIEPYHYVNKISLNARIYPSSTTNVSINYYIVSEENNDILCGTQELTLHTAKDDEEVKTLKEDFLNIKEVE